MTNSISKILLFLFVGLTCCKSPQQVIKVNSASVGTDYTIALNGTIRDVISGQPIPGVKIDLAAFTTYFYDTTDNSGNFRFSITDNDSVIKNNPVLFSQTDYQVGWLIRAEGYRTWYDSTHFTSAHHFIVRTKTTYLVPYNIDSLILGWTVKDLIDSLQNVPYKQRLFLKRNGTAVLQFEIQEDVFLQAYTQYDTLKWKDGELESSSNPAFMTELYEHKITGTARLIWGIRNSTRYINVPPANIHVIDTGGRVE